MRAKANINPLLAAILSGILWYAYLIGLIVLLRFLGVHITGIWPLHP